MLPIYILYFSTDEHLKLIKGIKLLIPFENSLFIFTPQFENSDLKLRLVWHIIEKSIMQMSNIPNVTKCEIETLYPQLFYWHI